MRISGNFLSLPGPQVAANVIYTSAQLAQALGRLPSGAIPNPNGTTNVNLLLPGELYGEDRISQVDLRFAKILRFGGKRLDLGMDLYNLFNSNTGTAYNQTYDPVTNGERWLLPTTVLNPRFARFNVTVDF